MNDYLRIPVPIETEAGAAPPNYATQNLPEVQVRGPSERKRQKRVLQLHGDGGKTARV